MNDQKTPVPSIPKVDEDEIDLLSLIKTIWNGRKTILLSIITGAILGISVTLFTPAEYTASTIMVPQLGNDSRSKMGGLGGLAALAGITIDANQGAEISPVMYPQIVNSIPFQLELMKTLFNFQKHKEPISAFDYFTKYKKPSAIAIVKKYSVGLPGMLIDAINRKPEIPTLTGDSTNYPIQLNEDQLTVQKTLEQLISLEVNSKDNYLTLKTRMPEPMVAAQMAQKAQNLLRVYITEYKIEKARANLNFIQGSYNEAKAEFEKAQVSLAEVTDQNKNLRSGLPRIETDKIQTRYTITFNLFQESAKQLAQAKLQLKQDTPVFTIIQPVSVPTNQSKPNRPDILLIWLFLGCFAGIGIVFGREYIGTLKVKWNEK